jgi:membrane-anchored mycosin MYCP
MVSRRAGRLVAVSALTLAIACGTPTAQAVSPPDVDDRWLPKPARPSSPWPTAQREVCAAMTTDSGPARDRPSNLGDLSAVWQLSRGTGQRVAVIDTGISRHRRLPDVVPGGDYVSTGDGTQDCDAHGTLVAGIIAATADSKSDRFSGVAPEATLISIRQSSAKFAPTGDRSRIGVGDVNTMANAVRTAADLGASVINISSVACTPAASAPDDRALGAALAYAVDVKNAVVVAAAGNTGGTGQCPPQRGDATWQTLTVTVSPAWYDDYVLTVGSVDADGTPSPFTLAGPWVDVAAPGEAVTSLAPEPVSGTSYAAPVVSGVAALIRARFPALTARQVMQRIKTTARHPAAGWDPLVGNGTVDPLAAVTAGTAAPADGPHPSAAPVPITARPPLPPRDSRARDTALRGAAICLGALTVAVAAGAARTRLRRARDRVPGD